MKEKFRNIYSGYTSWKWSLFLICPMAMLCPFPASSCSSKVELCVYFCSILHDPPCFLGSRGKCFSTSKNLPSNFAWLLHRGGGGIKREKMPIANKSDCQGQLIRHKNTRYCIALKEQQINLSYTFTFTHNIINLL